MCGGSIFSTIHLGGVSGGVFEERGIKEGRYQCAAASSDEAVKTEAAFKNVIHISFNRFSIMSEVVVSGGCTEIIGSNVKTFIVRYCWCC